MDVYLTPKMLWNVSNLNKMVSGIFFVSKLHAFFLSAGVSLASDDGAIYYVWWLRGINNLRPFRSCERDLVFYFRRSVAG